MNEHVDEFILKYFIYLFIIFSFTLRATTDQSISVALSSSLVALQVVGPSTDHMILVKWPSCFTRIPSVNPAYNRWIR